MGHGNRQLPGITFSPSTTPVSDVFTFCPEGTTLIQSRLAAKYITGTHKPREYIVHTLEAEALKRISDMQKTSAVGGSAKDSDEMVLLSRTIRSED